MSNKMSEQDKTSGASLAGIDGISANQVILGWALPMSESPRAVAFHIDDEFVGTALADRFHAGIQDQPSGFFGFSFRFPSKKFGSGISSKTIEIRDVDAGSVLANSLVSRVPLIPETSRGVLPVDAIVDPKIEQVIDEAGIDFYVAARGPSEFVQIAYAYALERMADHGGAEGFTQDIIAGRILPANLLLNMLNSEERRQRGPFLGPFVNDESYPFKGAGAVAPPMRKRASSSATSISSSDLHNRISQLEATVAALRESRQATPTSSPKLTARTLADIPPRRYQSSGSRILRFFGLSEEAKVARLMAAADSARDRRDWPTAQKLYGDVVSIDSSKPDVWVQYGHALKETGRLIEAEAAYRSALVLDSSTADTHLQLGHVLKLLGRLSDAREAYRVATNLSYPGDSSGQYAAAELAALE